MSLRVDSILHEKKMDKHLPANSKKGKMWQELCEAIIIVELTLHLELKEHTLGLRLQVIRKELISIGEITKQFNCERSVAEWYYDMAGKKKKRASRMLQNAIELEHRLTNTPECVICNEFMVNDSDNSPGRKYCSNRQCRAQQCQGSICKNCVQRLRKCPWCRK